MIMKVKHILPLIWSFALAIVNAENHNAQFFQPKTELAVALATSIQGNGTQLLIQISVPKTYTWAAFGSNSKMADSIMFVIYPSADGKSVLLSLRSTWEHFAPVTLPKKSLDVELTSSEITDDRMVANIVWKDRSSKLGLAALPNRREVDINSRKQPFIWAVGPHKSALNAICTNDEDESPHLTKHVDNGAIIVDMTVSRNAFDENKAPMVSGTATTSNVRFQPKHYHALVHVHLLLLCTAVVGFFPLGVIALRLDIRYKGTTIHWIIQLIAAVTALIGFAVALTFSVVGIQYSAFCTPHQMTAIVVCALIPFQAFLGRFGAWRLHAHRKRGILSYLHFITGRLIIYGGAIASILGFMLNKNMSGTIITIVCSIVLIALMEYLAIRSWMRVRKGKGPARSVGSYKFEARRLGGRYNKLEDAAVTESEKEALKPHDDYDVFKNVVAMESEVGPYRPGDRYDTDIPILGEKSSPDESSKKDTKHVEFLEEGKKGEV